MTDSMEKKINNEAMNNEELESVNGGEAGDYAAFLIARGIGKGVREVKKISDYIENPGTPFCDYKDPRFGG